MWNYQTHYQTDCQNEWKLMWNYSYVGFIMVFNCFVCKFYSLRCTQARLLAGIHEVAFQYETLVWRVYLALCSQPAPMSYWIYIYICFAGRETWTLKIDTFIDFMSRGIRQSSALRLDDFAGNWKYSNYDFTFMYLFSVKWKDDKYYCSSRMFPNGPRITHLSAGVCAATQADFNFLSVCLGEMSF